MSYTFQGKLESVKLNQVFAGRNNENLVKSIIAFDNSRESNGKVYKNTIAFELFGTERAKIAESMKIGATYIVSFDISSREYNGNFFTTLKAFKVDSVGLQQPQPQTPPPPPPQNTLSDDLPF